MKNTIVFRSVSVYEDVTFMPSPESGEPRLVMSQPIVNFIVPFTPTQISFDISAFVSNFSWNERYDMEIVIINASTFKELYKMPWLIHIQDNDLASQDITPVAYFVSNIKNMVVETEGKYIVEVRSEEGAIGSYYFEVFKKREV